MRSSASLQSSIVSGRTRSAPQSSGQTGAVSWTSARCCRRSRSSSEVVDLARPGGRPRSAAGGRGRAGRRAPRRGRARPELASPVTWTWRPSAGQWKSRATCGLASISFALRVHRAEVKRRASSSIRFRVTVRAEGRPPSPTVTKATEAGCGIPSARASSIQRSSSRQSGCRQARCREVVLRNGRRASAEYALRERAEWDRPNRGGGSDVRLRDRRSGLCRMRAGRAPLGGPGRQRAAARGRPAGRQGEHPRPARLPAAGPHRRRLGLRHGARNPTATAAASRSPAARCSAAPPRSTRWSTSAATAPTTTTGAVPAGAGTTSSPTSSRPRTTSAAPPSGTASAARWRSPTSAPATRSPPPSSRPGSKPASPATRTSTAPSRTGSGCTR